MFALALLSSLVVVNAQSAPDWNLIPKACATDCAKTIETSYLCQSQYTGGTSVYGCFCESYPSDAAACATCLTSNDAAALAALLTSTTADCPTQIKACSFACAFDTCGSSDVACQCGAEYLSNIYNCASCNTANSLPGTSLSDFKALNESCGAQSYAGAAQAFTTWVNSANGAAYTAPQLTATGGGEAATGSWEAASGVAAATPTAAAPVKSSAAAASGSAAAASGSAKPSAAGSASASAAAASGKASASGSAAASGASAAASSAAAAGSGANALTVPAGLVAIVAGAAALL